LIFISTVENRPPRHSIQSDSDWLTDLGADDSRAVGLADVAKFAYGLGPLAIHVNVTRPENRTSLNEGCSNYLTQHGPPCLERLEKSRFCLFWIKHK
jgi:hypothetical protein